MKKTLLQKIKSSAVAGIALFAIGANAQTNITVDANANWIGAMNVFNLEGGYEFYSDWGLADIKTEKNTTDNTLTLYPNYNVYNAADVYWANGEIGNKIMEASSLVINDELLGENITFSGTVVSNSLIEGYTVKAFVKALTADWAVIAEENQVLDAAGNFTIAFDASQYADAGHIQYGFTVTGLNGNPAHMATNGNMVVTSGDPQEPQEPEEITVTLDSGSPLIAYANWFDLEGAFVAGNAWGLADLKTTTDTNNNSIILQPNFSTYGTGDDPTYWTNGEIGNKIFEGNTYVEDNALVGQNVTFTGHTLSNTLAEGYEAIAFIKVYDASYGVVASETTGLTGGEDFTININVSEHPSAAHVQYGFSVTGLNANPDQEAALGSAIVSSEGLSTSSFSKTTATIYPNPANATLNIASENNIGAVAIYNTLGQVVLEKELNATQGTLDVSSLNSGIYIININTGGAVQSARFVKN